MDINGATLSHGSSPGCQFPQPPWIPVCLSTSLKWCSDDLSCYSSVASMGNKAHRRFSEIWHSLRSFGLTRNKKTLCDDFGCTRLYATSALKVYYVIDICHILRPAPITRDPANPPWFIQEHSSKSKTERISGCANRLKKG